MNARIIYKEGREGENVLDAIVGIAVPMLDGREVIVYPKYKECRLLEGKDVEKWKDKPVTEFEALRSTRDIREITDSLVKAGSPAAKFVRAQGDYSLPGLREAEAVVTFRKDIDKLASSIEGADLIDRPFLYVWSGFRGGAYLAWVASGGSGYFGSGSFYYGFTAVPVSLFQLA